MKKLKITIRRFLYILKSVIPAIIKEFNKKDGYTFRTNFDIEDEPFYKRTLDKLGADYRISNHATDCHERPISSCHALYVRGDYNYSQFSKLFSKYYDEKRARKFKKVI